MTDFFKYISEILSKFSPAQRILALLLLLLTITIISVTPVITDALSTTDQECDAKTGRLEKRIEALESENDTLITQIRRNRTECTDAIARREDEFMGLLDDLKRDIAKDAVKTHSIHTEMVSDMMMLPDSNGNYPVVTPAIRLPEAPQPDVTSIIKRIDKVKKCVKH